MGRMRRNRLGLSDDRNVRVLSEVPNWIASSFIIDHIKNTNLRRPSREAEDSPDQHYRSNEEFWQRAMHTQFRSMRWVSLDGFRLCDWYPRAPGLYYTSSARQNRTEAEQYITRDETGALIYEPSGKFHMIEGGIGSVRFKPLNIEGEDCWLYTATSDDYCHTGIPLAIPDNLLASLNFNPLATYHIFGQVRFLPEFMESRFSHLEKIPQIYILVNKIASIAESRRPILVTPLVFFTTNEDDNARVYGHRHHEQSKVTYVTCNSEDFGIMDEAVAWIDRYVHKYEGEVCTNFDQQRPTFRNAPFSLQNVMSGKIDIEHLRALHIHKAELVIRSTEVVNMEVANVTNNNEVNIGDGNSFQGDFVVAGSIANSFNKVASSNASDELKELLKQLATAVGQMSKDLPSEKQQEVAQDLDALTSEAIKEKPRRRWWEVSSEGLAAAAKNIGDIGKPVLEILTKLMPLMDKVAI